MTKEDTARLKTLFLRMDKDGDGKINETELYEVIRDFYLADQKNFEKMDEGQDKQVKNVAKNIVKALDLQNKNKISYSDFL